MNKTPFTFLIFLVVSGGFFQAAADEAGPSPYGGVRLTPRVLEVPGAVKAAGPLRLPRLAGSALVEVWGDSIQERLRLFRMDLAPALVQAYTAGFHSSATSQQLGEFMTMTASDVRPPSVPSVFYNSQRRVEDPELARDGIHIGVTSSSTITISAPARRR